MQRLIRDRPFMHLAAIIFTGFMGENVYAFYIYTRCIRVRGNASLHPRPSLETRFSGR